MQKLIGTALVSLVSLTSLTALAGDFMDTRLSFVFADDNVLAEAGETTPSSPRARFGAGNQNTQFYDNFNTRFSGFESLSHIVLYKKSAAFFEGLETEASLNVLVLEQPSGQIGLTDDSSYIRVNYTPPSWKYGDGVSFTGFPVSADRFRLGYAYRITWGGSSIFAQRAQQFGAPGAKLQLQKDNWYAFVGGKTALILSELIDEQETNYGLLYGAGIDLTPELRLDANGGWFQKGLVPSLATNNVRAPVNALGASAQAVWHVGTPVGQSVDLSLYRNDPDVYQRMFKPESYPGGVSWSVSAEGSFLTQSLEDPDEYATTVAQPATAAALQARMKVGFLRAHVLALYRSLSFIQFNVPGFPPFRDFPSDTEMQPEMFVALGADYHLPQWHLTPGVIVGVQQPAAFRSPVALLGGNQGAPSLGAGRWIVVREANSVNVLPTGYEAIPILSAKGTFRWDISETVAAVGEVYYTFDANRVTFKDDETGIAEPTFEKEHGLGFNMILQARF